MKLNPVNRPKGHNRYCGPAVISAVTGCTTNEAASVIRLLTGRWSIKGTYSHEVRNALTKYGVTMSRYRMWESGLTLTQWLKANKDKRTSGRVFLLVAGNHWQLVSGRRYVCGKTKEIVSVKDKQVKRRARVTEAYELTGTIALCEDVQKRLDRKANERKRDQSDRARLRRLIPQAKQLGLTVENDSEPGRITYWVSPDSSWRDDPREDEHFAHDADMMLELIEYYRVHEDTHRKVGR